MNLFSQCFQGLLPRTSASVKNQQKSVSKSMTTTLNTAVLEQPITSSSKEGKNFKYDEAGRRYHGYDEEIAYFLPNDDDEADRLHEQHWILKYALKRNYLAPVDELLNKGITVLDSGCGPGTWTLELSENFPNSNFHGIDISPIFPESIKPANVELSVANIAKHIPFPDNTFDYIHQRLLLGGLTNDNWQNCLKELYRVLKSGGFIELAEFSIPDYDFINLGPLYKNMVILSRDHIFALRDIPFDLAMTLQDRLDKSGFINVVQEITLLPLNHDGKRGTLLWRDFKHGMLNVRALYMKTTPEWTDQDVYAKHLDVVGEECKEYATSIKYYVCYAQKPL